MAQGIELAAFCFCSWRRRALKPRHTTVCNNACGAPVPAVSARHVSAYHRTAESGRLNRRLLRPGRKRLERQCQTAGSTRRAQFRSRRSSRPRRLAAPGQQHQPRARRWRGPSRAAHQPSPRSTSIRSSNSASCLPLVPCGRISVSAQAIRAAPHARALTAPHETALFAMAANRLERPELEARLCRHAGCPTSPCCPSRRHCVDQLYRALDFLAVWSDEIERDVFLRTADLFRLDVDLIFYDTTTAYFEIDEPDEDERGIRRPAFRPAASSRPQQGRARQSASGDHRSRRNARRHAGALLGAARRYRRRGHRGAHQAGSAAPGSSAAACSSAMPGMYSADNLAAL